MTISKVSALVSSSWLRQQLTSPARAAASISNNLRILDTSWLPNPKVDGYKEFYQQGHISTALHFDLNKISPPSPGPTDLFPLPDPGDFQDYVEDLGISNNTHVIAYDRLNTRPSFRTWFLFRLFGHDRVSILNGGLKQWVAEGNHLTTDETEVEPAEFTVKLRPELLRDFAWVTKNAKSGTEQVMDARPSEGFQESCIPRSKNIPYSAIFNNDGTIKDTTELKELFDQAGLDLSAPVTSSCLGGLTACGLILAAHTLGKEDVPLYNGSYSEWRARASPDMIVRPTS